MAFFRRIGIGRRIAAIRLDFQAAALRFVEHPDQRNVGQRIVGIAAADVGMHAGEPDLADLLICDVTLLVRIEFEGGTIFSSHSSGMERALFIERRA